MSDETMWLWFEEVHTPAAAGVVQLPSAYD